jgi:ferredoxin
VPNISVRADACVGAGQCALVAETLFDQDDNGIVILLNDAPDDSEIPAAKRAASLCPARAITIQDS